MQHKAINFKTIANNDLILDPESNISFERVNQNYLDFVGKNSIKLSECISFKRENVIKKHDLYFSSFFVRESLFRKFNNEELKKGVWQKVTLINKAITENYLIWLFQQNPILEYLKLFTKGIAIPYISVSALLKLEIPLPQAETSYSASNGKYSKEFNFLLEELGKCEKYSLHLSAVMLIGSIAEGLLNGFLKSNGIEKTKEGKKIEETTLGNKIQLLEQADNLSKAFATINSNRNCIHINRLQKKHIFEQEFLETKEAFSIIIRELGI